MKSSLKSCFFSSSYFLQNIVFCNTFSMVPKSSAHFLNQTLVRGNFIIWMHTKNRTRDSFFFFGKLYHEIFKCILISKYSYSYLVDLSNWFESNKPKRKIVEKVEINLFPLFYTWLSLYNNFVRGKVTIIFQVTALLNKEFPVTKEISLL